MSLFGSGRREGLLAVLTLLLISIALHAPGLFLGAPRGPSPALSSGWTGEASTNRETLLPAMRTAGAVAKSGQLPLWNTNSRFGEPFLTSGAPILYPPFWLLMLDGGPRILDLLLCLHTFLACMCMFRFCRNMPLGRYVSFLAGALYGLGWFFTAQLDRLPDAAAAALLPLAMEFTWRTLTSRRRGVYAGWLALVIALLFTTGGTGVALLGVLLCGALVLHGMWALDHENQALAWKSIGVTAGLAVLLSSPIWIHHLVHAPRLHGPTTPLTPHLQLAGLLGTLSPVAFGGLDAAVPENLRMVNAAADPLELVLFPGTVVLFLGLLGLLRPKRTSLGLFWIAIGGIGLMLSIDGPIASAFYGVAPASMARPGIALVLVHLAFVVLAATALERFFESPLARSFAVPVTAGVTIAVGLAILVLGFVTPGVGCDLIATFASGTPEELRAALQHLRIALLPTALFGIAIAVAFLSWRRIGMLRFKVVLEILVIGDLLTIALLYTPRLDQPPGESPLTARLPEQSGRVVVVGRSIPVPATPALEAGMPTITTTTPGILSRTADLLAAIDPSTVLINHRARVLPLQSARLVTADLLDNAAVGVVLTGLPYSFEGFASIGATPTAAPATTPRSFVHYRTRKVERASLRFAALKADSPAAARAAVEDNLDRLAESVVIEGADTGVACVPPTRTATVAFEEDTANRIRLRVDTADGQGYLLLADAYAPGWTATLDGEPVRIHPANVGLRAVAVPPGEHVIVFRYAPWMNRLGLPIATFGLLLLLVWLSFAYRRR